MIRRVALIAPLALLAVAAGPIDSPISLGVTQGLSSGAGFSVATPRRSPPTDSGSATVYTPAPTPNVDLIAPVTRDGSQASVAPGLFQPRNQYGGEGYVPNSTVQTEQERRLKLTPGIALKVPLQ